MNTIAYVFILGGMLLIRQTSRGRAKNLGTDISDAFTAIVTGDGAGFNDVLSRTGDDLNDTQVGASGTASDTSADAVGANGLISEMMLLGKKAKGYRLGSTGPDYYDCSGLTWRACKNLGYYTGARFTTHTFGVVSKGWTVKVSSPDAGDIVLWPMHHMGVVTGKDTFYSARSRASGIKSGTISGFSSALNPVYYRITSQGKTSGSANIPAEGGTEVASS